MCGCSGFSNYNSRNTIISVGERSPQPGAGIAGTMGVVGSAPYNDFGRAPSRVLPRKKKEGRRCKCGSYDSSGGKCECTGKWDASGKCVPCSSGCCGSVGGIVAPSGGYSNYGGYGFWCNKECAKKRDAKKLEKHSAGCKTFAGDSEMLFDQCMQTYQAGAQTGATAGDKAEDVWGFLRNIGLFGPRDGGAIADAGAGGPYPDEDKKSYTGLWVAGIALVVVGGTWFAIRQAKK